MVAGDGVVADLEVTVHPVEAAAEWAEAVEDRVPITLIWA